MSFPTDLASNGSLLIAANNVSSTLNGGISAGASDMTLASTANFPASGGVTIESEAIIYTSNNTGSSILSGLSRGVDSTTAATHADGIPVYMNWQARHHNAMKDEIIGIETFLTSSTFVGMGRNRVINGDMRIDQRNAGATVTVNSAAQTFGVDRWFAFGQAADGVFTIKQSATSPPTGFTHSILVTTTTADAAVGAAQLYYLSQRIEGDCVREFQFGSATAKTVTVSFWVKSSLTGTFCFGLLNGGATRAYRANYTISAANTWEFKTITIAGDQSGTWPTDNTAGMRLIWDLGSGSDVEGTVNTWAASDDFRTASAARVIGTLNATWNITGVQIEIGSIATAFEFRPEVTEMRMCERYYELGGNASSGLRVTGLGWSDGTSYFLYSTQRFRVMKRTTPTVTLTFLSINEDSTSTNEVASYTTGTLEITTDKFNTSATKAVAGNRPARQNFYWVASSEL